MARGAAQFLAPAPEERRDDLSHLGEVVGEVGSAEHAELLDERCQAAAIDEHRDASAGARLFQDVFIGSELRTGVELNLDLACRALLDFAGTG